MVRKHFYFSGRVQGVGFRYQSAYYARRLGLTGWVRNLSDGRVEMEVQGKEALITQLILELKHTSSMCLCRRQSRSFRRASRIKTGLSFVRNWLYL